MEGQIMYEMENGKTSIYSAIDESIIFQLLQIKGEVIFYILYFRFCSSSIQKYLYIFLDKDRTKSLVVQFKIFIKESPFGF